MTSNIRVFVQWKDSTVFAGEDIECTITFKNVAPPSGRDRSPLRTKQNGFSGTDRQRKLPPVNSSTRPSVSRNSSVGSHAPPPHLRTHRPTLSLHTLSNAGDRRSPVPPNGSLKNGSAAHAPATTPTHGRSLSIMSMGTDTATEVGHDRGAASKRPMKGHGRSASLQVIPGRSSPFPGIVCVP